MNDSPTSSDGRDAADAMRWEAVEEATELLHEERYHEALAPFAACRMCLVELENRKNGALAPAAAGVSGG